MTAPMPLLRAYQIFSNQIRDVDATERELAAATLLAEAKAIARRISDLGQGADDAISTIMIRIYQSGNRRKQRRPVDSDEAVSRFLYRSLENGRNDGHRARTRVKRVDIDDFGEDQLTAASRPDLEYERSILTGLLSEADRLIDTEIIPELEAAATNPAQIRSTLDDMERFADGVIEFDELIAREAGGVIPDDPKMYRRLRCRIDQRFKRIRDALRKAVEDRWARHTISRELFQALCVQIGELRRREV